MFILIGLVSMVSGGSQRVNIISDMEISAPKDGGPWKMQNREKLESNGRGGEI